MFTCKDCVHYEACKDMYDGYSYDFFDDCNFAPGCIDVGLFKNKADFVEVETIKSWLYEMALNNVGCHIKGDFSNACEEIISRLERLKRYSIEKEGADNG